MRKLLIITLVTSLCLKNYAQTKPAKPMITSENVVLVVNDKALNDSDKVKSYFTAGLAAGNRLLSIHNKVLNAKQTEANVLIYTPSIAYQNKSGFNVALGSSLLNDTSKGFGVNQYYITTGYQLQGNNDIDFSLAYNHFFIKDKNSTYSSPIQNDLFISFTYKKTWLQPSVAFDFSSGNSYEVNRKRALYDSITNKLKAYAFIASVGHEFNWESVVTADDSFTFTPSFLLNLGSSKINIIHKTNALNVAQLVGKKGKLVKFQNSGFAAESFGVDFDFNYTVGHFTFEPDLYLDYYLPATSDSRTTGVFNINLSYKF